ncbi:MAG: 2-oxoglutarate ferredoxin oxidoreductase subunit beta [Anaerolineae bacterium]|nr:2-oxoglutarate ferredoxin oxidoreductase subunit beta [Anaerolineae bacterium]MCQ3980651.1 2-oxoglutarate ferredoxin oxidoreductase subunit beta [Anaerolineae bacterium]GIK39047.1 MAG: 2-oxoglutarate ferredoxin oxidoreductase subunit beta [Chloroflexota bacterium]
MVTTTTFIPQNRLKPVVNYNDYLRNDKMPTLWCSGCGDGLVMKALIRAVDELGWDKDSVAVVSGIGCSGRMSSYLDFNTLHTPHGRTLPFATGLKLAKPDAHVIIIAGDGDALAIGGNHFLHACRRNIDLTLIIINNFIYGLTGGQFSPTTPPGSFAQTSPDGSMEPTFDTAKVAIAAGATYVARSAVSNPRHISEMIRGGLAHQGMAVVEVISNCHVNFGRRNVSAEPEEMIAWIARQTISPDIAQYMSAAELNGRLTVGVLQHLESQPEYVASYYQKANQLRGF